VMDSEADVSSMNKVTPGSRDPHCGRAEKRSRPSTRDAGCHMAEQGLDAVHAIADFTGTCGTGIEHDADTNNGLAGYEHLRLSRHGE